MDFSGVISPEDIAEVEHEVNVAISKNIPIEVTYPSRDELAQLEYRSKIEIEGQVRIVTVPGYDVCACCAPHVKRTGEIGMLKVMNYQNYKGGVRISILVVSGHWRLSDKSVTSSQSSWGYLPQIRRLLWITSQSLRQ